MNPKSYRLVIPKLCGATPREVRVRNGRGTELGFGSYLVL